MSNQARDRALEGERHAYDVTLLTRTVDASISRSEAALGRFVLDEEVETSGNIYYSQWRLAGQQIDAARAAGRAADPQQRERVAKLDAALPSPRRRNSRSPPAATSPSRARAAPAISTQAAGSPTGSDLSRQARRDRRGGTHLAPPTHGGNQILLGRSRPPDRLSQLAGRDRRAWRDLPGPTSRFRPFASVAARKKPQNPNRARRRCSRRRSRERTRELCEANAGAEGRSGRARGRRGAASPGPEDGGGRPADRRHRPRLQQYAGGGGRRHRSRPPPPERPAARGAEPSQQCDGRRDPRRRADPPPAVLRPVRAAAAGARRQPRALLPGCRDLLDRTLGERIQVETELADDAWPVFVDPHQLENAIVNLAVNARDAMDGDGPADDHDAQRIACRPTKSATSGRANISASR